MAEGKCAAAAAEEPAGAPGPVDMRTLDENRTDEDRRFLLELEFVQCLANPGYLHCELLKTNRVPPLFPSPAPINNPQLQPALLARTVHHLTAVVVPQSWRSTVSSRSRASLTTSSTCCTGVNRSTQASTQPTPIRT